METQQKLILSSLTPIEDLVVQVGKGPVRPEEYR